MCWNYIADFDIFLTSYQLLLWYFWWLTDPQQAASTIAMQKASVRDVLIRMSPCTSTWISTKAFSLINAHTWINAFQPQTSTVIITCITDQWLLFPWKQVYKKCEILKYIKIINITSKSANKGILLRCLSLQNTGMIIKIIS